MLIQSDEEDEALLYKSLINPKKKLRKKYYSENSIYGIFANDHLGSSDEEDGGEQHSNNNPNRPIQFVSGGTSRSTLHNPTQSVIIDPNSNPRGKPRDNGRIEIYENDKESSSDDSDSPKSDNLGQQKFITKKRYSTQATHVRISDNSDSEDDEPTPNTVKFQFSDANPASTTKLQDYKKSQPKASWNMDKMHKAYGVGFKMIQKMGYAGGSLGTTGDGLVNPIEIKPRTKNLGLQNKEEKSHDNGTQHKPISDQSALEILLDRGEKSTPKQNWKASRDSKPSQIIYKSGSATIYDTLESLSNEKSQFMRIIDMTGEQPRVINSSETNSWAVNSINPFPSKNSFKPLNKLHKSLLNLKSNIETNLKSVTRDFKLEENAIISLAHDIQQLNRNITLSETKIEDISHLKLQLSDLQKKFIALGFKSADNTKRDQKILAKYTLNAEDPNWNLKDAPTKNTSFDDQVDTISLSLSSINSSTEPSNVKVNEKNHINHTMMIDLFNSLSRRFEENPDIISITRIAFIFIIPIFRHAFHNWDPSLRPNLMNEELKDWFKFFNQKEIQLNLSDLVIYDSFISLYPLSINSFEKLEPQPSTLSNSELFQIFLDGIIDTPLRHFLVNEWSAFDPAPAITIIETWNDILSPFLVSSLLRDIIISKLNTAIESWNVRTYDISLSSFIHPWLPLLGPMVSYLEDPIRYKISQVIQNFYPPNNILLNFLSPWKLFFDSYSWESLLIRYITPKLQEYIRSSPIRPDSQNLEPIQALFTWTDLLGADNIADILDIHFFPEWLKVLRDWLSFPSADYQEIHTWYQGWKSIFPENIYSRSSIKSRFKQALQIINQVISSDYKQEIPTKSEPISQKSENIPLLPKEPPPPTPEEFKEKLSLKDYMEVLAATNNLIFKPQFGRIIEGKQVYSFGKVSMYIDNKVIFYFNQGNWIPANINDILHLGKTRKH